MKFKRNSYFISLKKPIYIPRSKYYLLDAIQQDLAMHNELQKNCKRGVLIEGESGWGKSTFYRAILEQNGFIENSTDPKKCFRVINGGDPDAAERLINAFHAGEKVILEEANLEPSLEILLIQLLTGKDRELKPALHAGFFVLASQNPSTEIARVSLSEALYNRMHVLQATPYSNVDLIEIADYSGIKESAVDFVEAFNRLKKEKPLDVTMRLFFKTLELIIENTNHSKIRLNDIGFFNSSSAVITETTPKITIPRLN